MKQLKFILLTLATSIVLHSGCTKEEDPLDHEQYINQAYIVGSNKSNNDGLTIVKIPYSKTAEEEQLVNVSVAVGGSQKIDRDISVELDEAGEDAITRYNNLYRYKDGDVKYQKLAASSYSIPNKTVAVKSGETYGTTPVHFKTFGLNADLSYAITLKIKSISDVDYVSIRKADTILMLSFSLTNSFSDSYQMQGKHYKLINAGPGDTTSIALPRTLNALDFSTVRLYHLTNTETLSNAAGFGVKIKVLDDNTLSITPAGTLAITAGGGTYNPTARLFNFWYNYTISGVVYQFKGKLIRNSA